MKKHLARYGLGLLLLLGALGHSVDAYRIDLVKRLDAIVYDARLRLTMPNTRDERVVILDIDEKSLAEQGRWPWGRDRLATLMDRLFDHYAVSLVGFDVVFAEPDISSGIKSLETIATRELRNNAAFQSAYRELRPQLDFDGRFAASLKNRKIVLGYYLSNLEGGQSSGAIPAPAVTAEVFAGKPIAFTRWLHHGGNLPAFQAAAASAGHFNPLVDFDGLSRRVPLLVEYKGGYYESLSLSMVRTLIGAPPVIPGFVDAHTLEWLEVPTAKGNLRIPVDENVAALVPYRGTQGSFRYVSATDVLNKRINIEALKNKIILVGTTAPGLMDLRATPVDAAYPGVEVHANLIAGILDGAIKHKPGYLLAADTLQVLCAGALMVFLLPLLSPLKATLLGMLVSAGLIGMNLMLWNSNLVMPIANALLLVLLLYAINMSWGYFVESKTKRQFAELFGQYVPPELVDEMARNPENYTMEGRKEDLTVLFSDIRGFTTISESLQPDQLAALMNEYLGSMTAVVRKHRGTLDKYIGDAIMAFWGAPVHDPDHANNAVLTALEMQQTLAELNKRLLAKGWPELHIGIGINTGLMTVGDMGSPIRKAYTVMGDAVNLGSRLEGITKQYGVGIIIGEGTREKIGKRFVLRELDRVRVKGKAEPIGIYEPLGLLEAVAPESIEDLKLWDQMLRHYRAQEWDRAEMLLMNLIRKQPNYLYDLYATRISQYREDPPGNDWDGVTTFTTK